MIAITDEYGKTVAKYAYDAWGKCTIVEDTSERGIATCGQKRNYVWGTIVIGKTNCTMCNYWI